jgi:hypothetical protein
VNFPAEVPFVGAEILAKPVRLPQRLDIVSKAPLKL